MSWGPKQKGQKESVMQFPCSFVLFLHFVFLLFVCDNVSPSPGWPQTHCVAENDLELVLQSAS